MQQYERETYYDQTGRIIFTTSKGLVSVGLPRKGNAKQNIIGWEDIKDLTTGTVEVTLHRRHPTRRRNPAHDRLSGSL